MFSIKVEGLERVLNRLNDVEKRQMPFATSKAMNRTANRIKKNESLAMKGAFNSPVRYTLNSLFVKPSTKRDLTAIIGFKDKTKTGKDVPASKYIRRQILGVKRVPTRFEKQLAYAGISPKGWYAMPGYSVPLNKYGNMTRGTMKKILSAKNTKGMPNLGKGKQGPALLGQFFAVGLNHPKLLPGVYKRLKRGVRPWIIFVKKQPKYKERFPFHKVAQTTYKRHFATEFHNSFAEAMKTARR